MATKVLIRETLFFVEIKTVLAEVKMSWNKPLKNIRYEQKQKPL